MVTKRKFNIPIYDYKVEVVIFDDIKEVVDKYPEMNNFAGITRLYDRKCTLVLPSNDLNTVVHECEHAKNAIWEFIGYIPSAKEDEVDAYLLTYIFSKVMEVIKKHTSI